MPPKRKARDDDLGAEPSQADLNKRAREEEPSSGVFETDEAVRRSSRRGKGSGGQLARLKDFERLQTTLAPRSKRLSDLDAATEGFDFNPMAPSQPTTAPGAPSIQPRPKPRLKTKAGVSSSQLGSPLPPTIQPSFSLAAPGEQFGFRLPPVGQRELDLSSTSSRPRSSRGGSFFSAGSHPSTAPTSRAHSVCSSQGDLDTRRGHGHSPHLKRLADASQSGVEAPRRFSRVTEDLATLRINQQHLHPLSQDQRQTVELLPQSQDLARLDGPSVGDDTRSTTPNEDENLEQDENDLIIDETTPSDDDRFAEAVLRGEDPDQQSQDRARYQQNYDDVRMDETAPNDNHPSTESFRRENNYAREQSEARNLSDIRRFGQVASQNNHQDSTIIRTENVELARQQRIHERNGMRELSDTERSIQAPSRSNDRGSTDRHTEGVMLTRRRQMHSQSEARDPSDTERSGHVPSQSHDHGSRNNRTEDVLLTHRQRNRAPRLPSSSQLASIREQQYAQPQSTTRPPPSSSQLSGTANQVQRAVPPTSVSSQPLGTVVAPVAPATEGAEPWQIQFYKPVVQDVLERSKQFSHCDAASVDAFPVRNHFKSLAVEYVEEAISERRARGLPISDGWWPHYTNEICRLLWEDLGNWRSALRKKARVYAIQRYKWDPENRRQVNSDIARGLLEGHGEFLRNGVDENGYTNNLAHPALAGLILDFFYTGPSSLGKLFPEVFAAEVPRVTVAIAATALKVVLDEIVSSQAEVSFRVNTYSPVYLELLGLMKKCDTSAIHAEKTRALRMEWAHQGSNCTMEREVVATASTGFDVDLD